MSDTQRVMIRGHEAIVREEPPTQIHNEFPKHMVHPGFQPGTVGEEVTDPTGRFKYHVGGTSIRFPPVLVMTADQQAYQESQGYAVQGKSNPDAFARAMRSLPAAPNEGRIEYPKWVGGVLCNGPEQEAVAAAKRRAQLGIVPESVVPHKTDQDYVSEGLEREEAEAAGIKSPDQQRIEALEAQLAEMNANMAKLLALTQSSGASSEIPQGERKPFGDALGELGPDSIPSAADRKRAKKAAQTTGTDQSGLTRGQKIVAGRARKAAERAAQKPPGEGQAENEQTA